MADTIGLYLRTYGLDKAVQQIEYLENHKTIDIDVNVHRHNIQYVNDFARTLDHAAGMFASGSTLSRNVATFASGVGNAFASIGNIFQTNVIDTIERYFTVGVARDILGKAQQVMQRYDIMSTFTQYMNLAGVGESNANNALSRVNESILGLPIGLDEAAQRLRRYQMFLGDLDKATNLTIGIQKAIMAGGASEQMRSTAYMQIDRLLSAGKLAQSRQWLSLIQGLGVSMRYVTEEMGLEGMDIRQIADGLAKGTISTDAFLQALMNLGEGGSEAAMKLDEALNIYKGTLESWMSNIRYAYVRGGQNFLDALNETLTGISGKGITGYMSDYREFINTMFRGASEWVKTNPVAISRVLDSFGQFIESLGKFNVGNIAGNALGYIGDYLNIITSAVGRVDPGRFEKFAAFAVTLAGPLGKLFTAVSSGAPVMLGIFDRFKDYDFGKQIESIISYGSVLARGVTGLLNLIPDSVMRNIISFGLVWGKPLATTLSLVAGGLREISSTMNAGTWNGGFLSGITVFAMHHPEIAAAAAALAALAIALSAVARSEEESIRARKEDLGVDEIEKQAKASDQLADSIQKEAEARRNNVEQMELTRDRADELRDRILELNDSASTDTDAYAELIGLVAEWNGLLPDATLNVDENTRKLDSNSSALLSNASAYEQAMARIRNAALETSISQASGSLLAAQFQQSQNESQLDRATQVYNDAQARRRSAEEAYENWVRTYGTAPPASIVAARDNAIADEEVARSGYNTAWQTYYNQAAAIKTLNEELEFYKDQLKEGIITEEEYAEKTEETTAQIEAQANKYKELYENADKAFRRVVSGFEEVEAAADENLEASTKALESQQKFLDDYQESLQTVMDFLSESGDTRLAQLIYALGEMSPTDAFPVLAGLSDLINNGDLEAVDTFLEKWVGVQDSLDDAIAAVADAQTAAKDLQGLVDSMEGLPIDLMNKSREALEGLVKGTETVKNSNKVGDNAKQTAEQIKLANDVLEDVENDLYNESYETAMQIANGIIAATPEVVAAAQELVSLVNSALGNLHAPSVNVNTQNRPRGGNRAIPYATGGMVYAANGMFIPIGTDTVPAMLSPGEFVMKRRAVDLYGAQFMQQLNDLNIPAAFDSILGMGLPSLRSIHYDNRSYDDHRVTTQNVYTNNPAFAARINNKYVRAL